MLSILKIIQDFEPTGVGARDLRECLLLQLRACKQTKEVVDAENILENYFQEFTNKHFQKILSRTGMTEADLKKAMSRILRLNPSPGGDNDDSYEDVQQIVPDFILEDDNGHLTFSMPRSSVPELRINKKYADMLLDAKGSSERAQKEAAAFVRQKIDSAKWFVEALKQRQNTLSKTMQAILDYQYAYFASGDETKLKPMVLKDIAEKTGFDISTISRVVNSKYIETDFGIFPLKYFYVEERFSTHWLLINGNVKATVFNGRGEFVQSGYNMKLKFDYDEKLDNGFSENRLNRYFILLEEDGVENPECRMDILFLQTP